MSECAKKHFLWGLSLSEWGLRPEEEKDSSRSKGTVEAHSEEDIFKTLGLAYIPPSLREGDGRGGSSRKE
jgi:DNA polymerase/3'-5' exonuclease PolX